MAGDVVAMPPMMPTGRPAVVVHTKCLLPGRRGCRRAPGYRAGSSRQYTAGGIAGLGKALMGLPMQPRAGKFFTLFTKASPDVVQSGSELSHVDRMHDLLVFPARTAGRRAVVNLDR